MEYFQVKICKRIEDGIRIYYGWISIDDMNNLKDGEYVGELYKYTARYLNKEKISWIYEHRN